MAQNQQNKPVNFFQAAFRPMPFGIKTALSNRRSSARFINPFSYRISICWFGGVHVYPKLK
ncbi:MAG: hypothetical protein WBA76_15700 [Phormidesmis sp.]